MHSFSFCDNFYVHPVYKRWYYLMGCIVKVATDDLIILIRVSDKIELKYF